MLPIVYVMCDTCNKVQITVKDLLVRVCRDDGKTAAYSFSCPVCHMTSVCECLPSIADMLISSGAPYQEWGLPKELFEEHSGEPINHDDLIDFHQAFDGAVSTEIFAELA